MSSNCCTYCFKKCGKTDGQTDLQTKYRNPCCPCVPRIKKQYCVNQVANKWYCWMTKTCTHQCCWTKVVYKQLECLRLSIHLHWQCPISDQNTFAMLHLFLSHHLAPLDPHQHSQLYVIIIICIIVYVYIKRTFTAVFLTFFALNLNIFKVVIMSKISSI